MSNLNFHGTDVEEFSISYLFEPIDVVTFFTLWWPQLHSMYSSFFYLLHEISVFTSRHTLLTDCKFYLKHSSMGPFFSG